MSPKGWFSSTRGLGALSATCSTSFTLSTKLIADKTIWRQRRHWRLCSRCPTVTLWNCVLCSVSTASSVMRSIPMCHQQKEQRSPSCHRSSTIVYRSISLIWGRWGSGTFMEICSTGSWLSKIIRLGWCIFVHSHRRRPFFVAAELEKYFGFIGYPEIFHTGVHTIAFMLSQ